MLYIDDSGHGGSDPGAISHGNIEKIYTLEAGLYINKRMKELEFSGDVTRNKDETLSNKDRVDKVKQYEQSISHHFNSGGGDGLEVICSKYSDGSFERMIVEEFKASGYPTRFNPIYTRTMKGGYDYYFMHRLTGICKVSIIEYDFVDGPQSEKIKSKDYREGMYECVVRALCKYNNIEYKPIEVGTSMLYKILVGDFHYIEDAEKALKDLEHLGYSGVIQEEKRSDNMLKYNRPLKRGSMGEDVKLLQIRLNELGYYFGDIDGSFGPAMDKAVKAYQSANSLVDDGSVGPATINKINGKK